MPMSKVFGNDADQSPRRYRPAHPVRCYAITTNGIEYEFDVVDYEDLPSRIADRGRTFYLSGMRDRRGRLIYREQVQ